MNILIDSPRESYASNGSKSNRQSVHSNASAVRVEIKEEDLNKPFSLRHLAFCLACAASLNLVAFLIISSRDDLDQGQWHARLEKAREIERAFFDQKWSAGSKKTDATIRVFQFNVLAHGLSSFSSGYGTVYKTDAPCPVKNIIDDYKQKHPDAQYEEIRARQQEWDEIMMKGGEQQCYSAAEKQWLHSPQYREILFGRTWGQQPYGIPERIKRVTGLILAQNPDVMTLQEVDHFDYLSSVFNPLGYEGEINYKNLKCTRVGNGTYGNDGSAIFWNTERLEKVRSEHVKLHYSAEKKKLCNQRLLLVTLRNKVTKKEFVVVTGHLKSGNREKDVNMKKYHVDQLVNAMKKYTAEPIILAAFLNTPCTSEAFKHFQKLSGIFLDSAYDLNDKEHFSTVKKLKGGDQPKKIGKEKHHTIDYIFHSKQSWKCLDTLSIPKASHVLSETDGLGLPCWRYPSDHFMLAADLEMQ